MKTSIDLLYHHPQDLNSQTAHKPINSQCTIHIPFQTTANKTTTWDNMLKNNHKTFINLTMSTTAHVLNQTLMKKDKKNTSASALILQHPTWCLWKVMIYPSAILCSCKVNKANKAQCPQECHQTRASSVMNSWVLNLPKNQYKKFNNQRKYKKEERRQRRAKECVKNWRIL